MTVIRNCKQCGKQFRPQRASSAFCSRVCVSDSRRLPDAKWRDPEYIKEYQKRYQHENRARINEGSWRWCEANREKRRLIAANSASKARALGKISDKRKATVNADGAATSAEVRLIFTKARHLCVYCGEYTRTFEIDHYHPISKGGRHKKRNLIPCCRRCNASKGTSEADEWIERKFGFYGLARVFTFITRKSIDLRFYPDSKLKRKLLRAFNGIEIEVVR